MAQPTSRQQDPTPQPATMGWATKLFGCDERSLALLRIALASIILIDLASRFTNLELFYTDDGIMSVEACRDYMPLGFWSLHLLSGAEAYQQVLFFIAGSAALLMLVGCWTRVSSIVSWVLLVSLHVRNPLILNSGDTLLRAILFWSMLLPLDRRWALDTVFARWRLDKDSDRARKPRQSVKETGLIRSPSILLSGATVAIICQLAVMYFFAGLSKFDDPLWRSGGSVGACLPNGDLRKVAWLRLDR